MYVHILETEMFTAPAETKNISEYKDVVQKKTFALVYEVEYDGKLISCLIQKNSLKIFAN